MLFASLRRTFVVNKNFARKLDNLSNKIRTRKSVADMAKLQGTPSFLINGKFVGGFGQQELDSLIEATRQQIKSQG